MRYTVFIISLIFLTDGFGQDVLQNKSFFDKEVIMSIDYLVTTKSKFDNSEQKIDTTEFMTYKLRIKPLKDDIYAITLYDFLPRINVSNIDTLSNLYNDFIIEQEFKIESGLEITNPKIKNHKYIKGLAKKYGYKIAEISNNMFLYSDEEMFFHRGIRIPYKKSSIVERCQQLANSILSGYSIDLSKKYEYPYELELPLLETTYHDTLFYKAKDINDEMQIIDLYFHSDTTEMNKVILGLKGNKDNKRNIGTGEMSCSSKYYINRMNGKIEKILISSRNTSAHHNFEMNIEFKINYGG